MGAGTSSLTLNHFSVGDLWPVKGSWSQFSVKFTEFWHTNFEKLQNVLRLAELGMFRALKCNLIAAFGGRISVEMT
jgi:hypothetical protein